MDKPPPEPVRTARKHDLVELRITNLQRELEADPDPTAKAAILYHVGSLYEHDLGRLTEAMQCYAQASQAAPSFEPALIAQMRMAERDPRAHDVDAICAAMVAAAQASAPSSSALVDLALRSNDWASLLREAIDRSPSPAVPALVLEWLSEAAGDRASLGKALRAQAEHAADPALRAALWLDVALHEIEGSEVDAALDALELAGASEAIAWSARGLQRRLAKDSERWDVVIRATTSMASLLEDDAETGRGLDPLRLPIPVSERLPLAVALWQEAARYSADELGEPVAAARYLESALRIAPDDVQTRLQSLSLAERFGDEDAVERASAWFRESAHEHPAFVAQQIRAAVSGEREAIAVLREVVARNLGSAFARAALDVALMKQNCREELARQLREQADASDGEARQLSLWRAALLSAATRDGADSTELLDAASMGGRWQVPVLRDALGLALGAQRADAVVARCDDLLECHLAPDERALIAFSKYDVTQNALGQSAEAERLLRDAIGQTGNESWAPHLARVHGALGDDPALLARAHEALADLTDGEARIAHLCGAGEAHARAGNWDAAQGLIRRALKAAPNDGYVRSLLDGVLREGGQTEQVVALARERARAHSPDALAELSLLLAGTTAERNAKPNVARDAYEQALANTPASASAALALADVARHESDSSARLRAYASLADGPLGGGAPELFALLRADALALDEATARQASESYERTLDHPITELSGATALLSMPRHLTSDDMRASAEEALADMPDSMEVAVNGFGAAYGGLRASLGQEGASTGDAWLQLAALAPTEALRAEALLQGLRTSRIARGEQALDDLFILAQEAADLAEVSPEAAIALDEALAPGDDPELRAAALERKLEHATALGRGAITAATSRALVEAGKGTEAVALLSTAVEERPDDLAIWEILRSAARQAGQWPLVAQACERLAQFVEGSLRADLLEEAAVVRLDCMEQHQQAEDLFRSALDADPKREIAFRRLHDLLAQKEDAEALEALVSGRLSLGGAEDRPDLLYERARLLRGFSDRPGALEVLGELFTTDPDHAGALALAAEVHVSLEQWEEAVACLRRLARSGIPDEQRRLAHLGAADFLETRLGAKDEALAELRAIEGLGLADADTLARIGLLEEEVNDHDAAVGAYTRALESEPTHAVAVGGLVRLLDDAAKQTAIARYEKALWERFEAGELDASTLQAMHSAATWRGHAERAAAIRAVEQTLGLDAPRAEPWTFEQDGVFSAALWDRETSPVLDDVLRRVGSSLFKPQVRTKKVTPNDPIYVELERLCEQLGVRVASVALSTDVSAPAAYASTDLAIHWLMPSECRDGLDERSRFLAGRLAWAAPRGAGWLLDDSASSAAGKIAALLRAARCDVAVGEAMLPAAEVKLRRAARRSVQEAVGGATLSAASLLTFARSLHRSGDRAGLLACGDIGIALATVLHGVTTIAALRASARGLDLARFCMDAESPLWRSDGRR